MSAAEPADSTDKQPAPRNEEELDLLLSEPSPAALAALESGPAYCRQYLAGFDAVRTMVLHRLKALQPRLQVATARGAFYVFMNLRTTMTSLEVCESLIRKFRVAAIPGSTFGHATPSIRIAYGNLQEDAIAEGMDRLCAGLDMLLE